jgi:single-strand DNA-binding protein
MYNKIILVGHLTRDIEVKYSSGGMAIAKTGIAVNNKFKTQTGEQREEVMFIELTFFGRTAEVVNQYLRKGSKLLVEGKLKLEQWTGQDGTKRSRHSVTVDNMTMLDNKGTNPSDNPVSNGGGYGQNNNAGAYNQPPQQNNYNQAPQNDYQAPQQNNYRQPEQNTYNQAPSRPSTPAPQLEVVMPEIDINEDEIPF